jgi:hypothetical protein
MNLLEYHNFNAFQVSYKCIFSKQNTPILKNVCFDYRVILQENYILIKILSNNPFLCSY